MVNWNGIEYPSVAAAAKANGISRQAMWERIRKGYSLTSDMIGTGRAEGMKRKVIWNGVEYPSIAKAAAAHGITHAAMRYRVERGYTCDDDMR